MKRVLVQRNIEVGALDDDDSDWIGDVAVIINIVSMLPQLWHVYKRHDAKSLSYIWLGTSLVANFFWLTYGIRKGVSPLIYSAVFFITAFLLLGTMKFMFDK